ncbi:peroxisomal multifunctional enzyme type 2-like [Oppia nitens]|uniref:peroxisomal multifunctional enzyme type 2-like n=1 Tax=Oppia nitens TaxID=1686743 RepID=UPI0023D9A6DC|nr:peroxisomal multifunctional enzyme type 2-like [Oppia nitens]
MSHLRYDGRVAVVTGAARGLGKEYALLLSSKGASLVVNDLGGSRSGEGTGSTAADEVVRDIISRGGKAVADYNSVEEGHKIIKTAIDNFGRIDILINNAGILRDISFTKLTQQDWDIIHNVHLKGSMLVTKAAWPYFQQQKYGRIVMTSSPAGIYGNFGQTNYSSAKLGLVGLSNTLAVEGAKYNIKCNTIAPVAASRLTEDIFPEIFMEYFKPSYVAPLVAWLSHEDCPETGGLFETAGGFVGKYQWMRSDGKIFTPPDTISIEAIRDNWQQITDMNRFTSPNNFQEHTLTLVNSIKDKNDKKDEIDFSDNVSNHSTLHNYTIDDTILYALSVGVSTQESKHLSFLYECNEEYSVIPTYGAVVSLSAAMNSSLMQDAMIALNITGDVTKLVHGEQYLQLLKPIPPFGSLKSVPKIIDVLDKGSGALFIIGVNTYDETDSLIFYNQLSLFMIGAGNFNGKRVSDDNSIIPIVEPPKRTPDAIILEKTSIDQAALYRLCGDKNPLHIDPIFAMAGGFQNPILHGLCTMGYALRHVLKQYADYNVRLFDCIKTRFVGPITPGQTIETRMWKEGKRIHFESFIKETGKQIIKGAYVDINHNRRSDDYLDNNSNQFRLNEKENNSFILNSNVINTNNALNVEEIESYSMDDIKGENLENNIKFVCAPYGSNDGQSGGGGDEHNSRIDKIFDGWLSVRISDHKELVPIIKTVYQWNITKNNKVFTVWTLDLKNGNGAVYKGSPKTGKADCTLIIDEEAAVNIFEGREDAMKAFMGGKLKISGNILAAQKLQQLWSEEAPRGSVSLDEKPMVSTNSSQNNSTDDLALLESVPTSGLKCDIVFNVFKNRMHEEPELVRSLRVVFQFNITIDGKLKTIWTTDNKSRPEGDVYIGPPKNGKSDCLVTVEDDDFLKLMVGKLNPQRAFMMGKLKIKGNIMLLQKLNSLWMDLQKAGKAPELPYLTDMMLKTSVIPGLRSESMIIELVQRLVRLPQLCTQLPTLIGFDITKDNKSVSQWTLDFTKNKLTGVFDRGLPDSKYCILTIDDDDFVRLTYNRLNLQDAISCRRIKVSGDTSIPQKINVLFATPTTRAKL